MTIVPQALKRSTVPATPSELLGDARQAQADHAAAIEAANQQLIDAHTGVYNEVHDRKAIISEQIQLLQAEVTGLEAVVSELRVP